MVRRRWRNGRYDSAMAMVRYSDEAMFYRTIAISLSYHRAIVIAPSRHRSIDPTSMVRCRDSKLRCPIRILLCWHATKFKWRVSTMNMIVLQMSQVDMDKCHVKIIILHVDIAYLTCRGQKVCPHTLIGIPTTISYSPWQTPYHLTTFRHKHVINQSQLSLTDTLKTTMSLPEKHYQPQHSLTST